MRINPCSRGFREVLQRLELDRGSLVGVEDESGPELALLEGLEVEAGDDPEVVASAFKRSE